LGVVGVLNDVHRHATSGFKQAGDTILLLGDTHEDLGGTEYLKRIHGEVTGKPPALDLAREQAVQSVCLAAVQQGLAASAHDCSDGGLAVTLAESCIHGRVGATVTLPAPESELRLDARLFGESASRIVLSATAENAAKIQALAKQADVPVYVLGAVGGKALQIVAEGETVVTKSVAEMEATWRGALRAPLRVPAIGTGDEDSAESREKCIMGVRACVG